MCEIEQSILETEHFKVKIWKRTLLDLLDFARKHAPTQKELDELKEIQRRLYGYEYRNYHNFYPETIIRKDDKAEFIHIEKDRYKMKEGQREYTFALLNNDKFTHEYK